MRSITRSLVALLLSALSAGCDANDVTAPYAKNLALTVVGGDRQFAAPGSMAPEPLQVRLMHANTQMPVAGMAVTWRVVQGSGLELNPTVAITDATGLASTRVRLGPEPGIYTIEASFLGLWGPAPRFTLNAASPPSITEIRPGTARPGEVVTIRGHHFSTTAADNAVYFDGLRALVTAASSEELRVTVPLCMATRSAQVRVVLGSLESAPASVEVRSEDATTLRLAVGQVARFADPATASCIRLDAPAGSAYLLVTQNATTGDYPGLAFQLAALTGQYRPAESYSARPTHGQTLTAAQAWEAGLRARERGLIRRGARRAMVSARIDPAAAAPPAMGETRGFSVPDLNGQTARVTAVVRAVSKHAVIYEDRKAPAGGFTNADFAALARIFDDPIYPTDVAVFGAPSDIDHNGRVLILLSPVVNALTPAGEQSFIAGFFNPDDLAQGLDDQEGSISQGNAGEMFYAVVPDPAGLHGLKHTPENIVRALTPVLAHELQHMIHFNQRLMHGAVEATRWLEEALAHTAEDTVGGVLLQRGDEVRARQFRRENYLRAAHYLADPASTSIVGFTNDGTLEERGGAWLFLKYLTGRFGGDLLQRLTESKETGAANVIAETQTGWDALLSQWAVALFADDFPDLSSTTLDARYRFANLDLRGALASISANAYPLQPRALPFSDFVLTGTLPSAAASYAILNSGMQPNSLHLSLTGGHGLAFAAGTRAQLTVMRLR